MRSDYHHPVMLREALEGLAIQPDGTYVDVTFGGGGHSRAILDRLDERGRLFAFDQDEDAVANQIDDNRFMLIPQNFRHLHRMLRLHKALPVDGILADLGISSHQIDTAERGFSTRFGGRLDMRMNQSAALDAHQVVNTYPEDKLAEVIRLYGELGGSHRIARAIVHARQQKPIDTTEELKAAVANMAHGKKASQFLARLFQAIRIEVNGELEVLKEMLQQSVEVLRQGGRLVVISYHSLEDRLVKNFMKHGSFDGVPVKDFYGKPLMPLEPVISKALQPTDEEILDNPRARSARMRIAQKR